MLIADFNPVALDLGIIQIRWYALAYLAGFLLGWRYLRVLIAKFSLSITSQQLDDFLSYAIAGVLLGGRLGYILFYDFAYYADHPLKVLYLWQGGMSFHGGLMGMIGAVWLYARQQKISTLLLGDLIACAGPIGLLFGRLANFVNGELWGRPTDLPWGVIFPHAGDQLARHPSQLYEAGLEGLLLFTLLWALAFFTKALKCPGRLAGIFLLGYAASRFAVEFAREPDAQLGYLTFGATMGQILCIPMALLGVVILLISFQHSKAS